MVVEREGVFGLWGSSGSWLYKRMQSFEEMWKRRGLGLRSE